MRLPSSSPRRIARLLLSFLVIAAFGVDGCGPRDDESVGEIRARLTAAQRAVRLTQIRDASSANGLANGVLLAGIADAETNLAHCWSEATWACQGPDSADCGGPVIAGAADGPCSDMQGGLGMFQFDAGTYTQTLAREGDRILSIAGNVQAAIDFVVAMVLRSTYITGVTTREEALAWMDGVVVGGAGEMEWIQTVTHYYNGCAPGSCSAYATRYAHYRDALHAVWDEMGAAFWTVPVSSTPCATVPAAGRVIDDTDVCVTLGGDPMYWRTATGAGYGGSLRWTITTDYPDASNYAVWNVVVDTAGDYELLVYVDPAYAQSAMARYVVSPAGTVVPIDQRTAAVQSLGTSALAPGTSYAVRVDDNTGEPESSNVQLVADALEVRPAMMTAPDAGMVTPPPPAPDGGVAAGDGGGLSGRPFTGASGGCAVGGTGDMHGAPWLAIAALGLALALRRRRLGKMALIAATIVAACDGHVPDAAPAMPAVVAQPVSAQLRPAPGDRVVLDTRADGTMLAGRLRPFPLDADPARVVDLDEAPAALSGHGVLDARFVGDAIVVVGTDRTLVVYDADGGVRTLASDAHAPISVAAGFVAFARGHIPELEIVRVDVRTGELRALTQAMAPAWSPALSADGRSVVFASGVEGAPRLYRADEDGTLTPLPRTARTPSSPRAPRWNDGVLAFDDERGETAIELATGREVAR